MLRSPSVSAGVAADVALPEGALLQLDVRCTDLYCDKMLVVWTAAYPVTAVIQFGGMSRPSFRSRRMTAANSS